MPDAQQNKCVAAVRTADAINAIEGVPPTDYAKALTAKWALGELSFDAAKAALLERHRRPVDPSWNQGRRDPYLYEEIPVLRNMLGIREENALDLAEAELSRLNMAGLYEAGFADFSPAGLYQIHRILFGDVYEWAGKPRVINMIKRERVLAGLSVWYSNDEDIPRDLKLAFRDLKKVPWETLSREAFVHHLARQFPKVWRVHPFREGNTRSVFLLLTFFVEHYGYHMDQEVIYNCSHFARDSFVMACLDQYSEYEHLEKLLLNAISEEPIAYDAAFFREAAQYTPYPCRLEVRP